MYVVNILTFQVTKLPDTNTSHADFSMIYHRGEVYVVSGYNSRNLLSPVVEKYSLSEGWRLCGSVRFPRSHAAVASVKNKIYVLGGNAGYKDESVTDAIEVYDDLMDVWLVIKLVLPLPLWKIGVCKVAENRVMFFGGKHTKGNSFISFELDFDEFKYTEKAGMPTNREGWMFLFEGKYFQNVVNSIESSFKDVLVFEREVWSVQNLKNRYADAKV